MASIGLCMIVKDEAEVITRCIESVRRLVDFVMIEDTGSSDGTQEICRNYIAQIGLPGEVVDEPWQDFGSNRTSALAHLRKHLEIDYALIMDADDQIIYDQAFDAETFKAGLDKDLYDVRIQDFYDAKRQPISYTYWRSHICRSRMDFRYRGVLHEFMEPPPGPITREAVTGFYIVSGRDGARGKLVDKFRRDAEVLERALETERDELMISHYTFYLANSYRNGGEPEKALKYYLARAKLGYWQEVVFFSLYAAAQLKEYLGRPEQEVIDAYLEAARAGPTRAEALHGASRFCRIKGRNEQGFEMARRGLAIDRPSNGVFIESWIYDYGLLDELSITAYWTGHYRESLDACERILRERRCPEAERSRIEANAAFARRQLGVDDVAMSQTTDTAIQPVAELILADLSKGAGETETTSEHDLVRRTGPERAVSGLRTNLIQRINWSPVHGAAARMDEDGRLVVSDGEKPDYHLLRWADRRADGARVKLKIVAKPAESCNTNLYVQRWGPQVLCSITQDGTVVLQEGTEDLHIERRDDGFLEIGVTFENYHDTISVGMGKPGGYYAGTGTDQYIFETIDVELLPLNHARQIHWQDVAAVRGDELREDTAAPSTVEYPIAKFGDLRRIIPISEYWGYDRGKPVDRRYIEDFLSRNMDDIGGRVLEVADNGYTLQFGGTRVHQSDILHVNSSNPRATLVGDLAEGHNLPSQAFDCIVLTQTLQLIFDIHKAVATLFRMLKPGGVLLATVPGISAVDRGEWGPSWCWSFSPSALRQLLEESFDAANISVSAYGNVLAAIAFLHGLAESELRQNELDAFDPRYPVIVAARAVKGA